MQRFLDCKISATLCYCDLDHLKYVNDNYGHDKGDTYICDFVKILKSNIREDDIIARLGGDEFCILFKNGSIDSISSKMEHINKEFSKHAMIIRKALVLELSTLMEMKRLLYLTSCKRLIKECMHKNEKSKMTTIQVVTFLTSYICL